MSLKEDWDWSQVPPRNSDGLIYGQDPDNRMEILVPANGETREDRLYYRKKSEHTGSQWGIFQRRPGEDWETVYLTSYWHVDDLLDMLVARQHTLNSRWPCVVCGYRPADHPSLEEHNCDPD